MRQTLQLSGQNFSLMRAVTAHIIGKLSQLTLSSASCSRIRRSSALASLSVAIVLFNLDICSTIFVRLVSPSAIDCDNDNNARAASSLMPWARAPCAPPAVLLSLNLAKADSQSSNSLKIGRRLAKLKIKKSQDKRPSKTKK